MKRVVIFVYGVLCYALSLVAFVYAVGFIGGFLTPTLLDAQPNRPLAQALGIDLALLAVFALQHSGMARPAFKRWWTRIVPEAAERSTYVLLSSLAVGAFFAFWQPTGAVIWQAEGTTRTAIIGIYLFGWALLFYTTFLIDHFDLLGLKQVWRQLLGREYRPPQFYTPSLYRVVRHPLYIGWLTIFWAAPTMTVSHLLFALATTAYILAAIRLEERDLVDAFGDAYLAYRRRTPMLVPKLPAFGRTTAASKHQARV
ncbi:MAG TPA: isoprenylcysteine carboxylmethyltransferase family protein [Steroidobacteraceae bacterium]|nr:isoprenylcysteine carboxylmethyltransferase family protein [Steroidobacteraceae bacterium]